MYDLEDFFYCTGLHGLSSPSWCAVLRMCKSLSEAVFRGSFALFHLGAFLHWNAYIHLHQNDCCVQICLNDPIWIILINFYCIRAATPKKS